MKIYRHYQLNSNEPMKKLRIIILLTMLLIISFSRTFAQQEDKTAYQQKIVEITQKYFKVLYGNNKQLTVYDKMHLELMTNGEEASRFMLGLGMLSYATNHSEADTKRLTDQIKAEFKLAEKLKTAVDFKREKEAREKKELEIYEKTDIGDIKKNIKSVFEQWNQKGEFEKESDYAIRLKKQSKNAFDSICTDKIIKKTKNKDSYNWEKELSAYNSEREFFTISFKINDLVWQSNVNIPIANAQNFKNDWRDLNFKVDDYDWSAINNSLCPTMIILEKYNMDIQYKFPVSLQNQSEILCAYDDFRIENPYLSGYVYKFSNAKAIAEQHIREKQRLDSLELVTFNLRLDSIFNNYNRQLLQNRYNVDRLLLKDYNKIANGDNRENSFSSSVSSMKYEFESMNNNFEYKRRNEYSNNGSNVFTNESEFESFYIKGKDTYIAEVEKRKVLKFLSAYSKFIETIDFQKEVKENIGSAILSNYTGSYTNYDEINKYRREILTTIKDNQNKPYYSQIIDFVIETNKDLNKEWTKNGQYFEGKVEFYNAFLSADYKIILKNNKKS